MHSQQKLFQDQQDTTINSASNPSQTNSITKKNEGLSSSPLPFEVWLIIFSYRPHTPQELANLATVCCYFYLLSIDDYLWRTMIHEVEPSAIPVPVPGLKDFYKNIYPLHQLAEKPHAVRQLRQTLLSILLFPNYQYRYFNLNIMGSDESNIHKMFDSINVLTHSGNPWAENVICKWKGIHLHPIVNGANDGTLFSTFPDVVLIFPKDGDDLSNCLQQSLSSHRTNTYLKIYCISIAGDPREESITNSACRLAVKTLTIDPTHLFIKPQYGRINSHDRERYLNSVGDSIRNVLNIICDNIQLKIKKEKQEQLEHHQKLKM